MPTELITLFGSSLLSGVMRLWGASLNARRQQHYFNMQVLNLKANIVNDARRFENPRFQWTRRLIALTSVFFVIAFPKIVAVFMPKLPVHIGYPEATGGFLFFYSESLKIKWVCLQGLVITPLDTHLLAAIIGLYFGGSLIGNR